MAVASRYWRVYFRSRVNYSASQLAWASLMPKDADGNNLTTGLTITNVAPLINATTYPLTALIDENTGTYCGINYASSNSATWYYIQFNYAAPVLVDRFLCNIYEAISLNGNTIVAANLVDMIVDSSFDNVTWLRQALIYGPIPTGGLNTLVAALTSSGLYPLPSAFEIGGGGGIYGIVSEDGVALPNRPVYLFERETFYRVGFTTTNEYGGYAFNGLNMAREFTVMSVDPSGPPYKNALIWDRIKPINTKGNLLPQSAFWARRSRERSLGGVASFAGYINSVYKYLKANVLGSCETNWWSNSQALNNFDFYPDTAAGGALMFLKSPRYRTTDALNLGLILYTGNGCFNGVNAAGNSACYQNLTFEYIIKAPQAPEGTLFIGWWGNRDSDDVTNTNSSNYNGYPAGPTLEVTTTTLNVRMPLGTNNLSIIRATTPIVAGAIYHVMVTFEQDVAIKLYVNGALIQTTAVSGSGRLFGWCKNYYATAFASTPMESWDYVYDYSPAAIRRFRGCMFVGTGNNSGNPAGWGGGVALTAIYGRTFSLQDVETFYDSMVNWETHIVPVGQSGYAGEVEADNPNYYWRLNELSGIRGVTTLVGQKDTVSWFEGSPGYNATGFTSGVGALTTSNGALIISGAAPIVQSIFTFECFIRPSASGTYRLFLTRVYNAGTYLHLSLVSGVLILTIIDHSGTTSTVTCPGTLSIGTAYHIAVIYDPWVTKLCNFVINGVVVSTQAATAVPDMISKTQSWCGIGCNPSSTGPSIQERFQGQMGEVAIYNYAVPVGRIAAHYAARNS